VAVILKWRKKPVAVEAMQLPHKIFDGHPAATAMAMLEFEGRIEAWAGKTIGWKWRGGKAPGLVIPTLEGEHLASPGDWIIRGVAGEFYPCKPDIFAATYEAAE
jgi:hypothetical protein